MLTVTVMYDGPVFSSMDGPFQRLAKADWFEHEDVLEWIANIDLMKHVMGEVFIDRWGHAVSPQVLSSGSKALCLMKFQDEYPVYATRCGDNCAPYLEKLSRSKDIHVVLHHCFKFSEGFEFFVTEANRIVAGGKDWVYTFYDIRRKITGV